MHHVHMYATTRARIYTNQMSDTEELKESCQHVAMHRTRTARQANGTYLTPGRRRSSLEGHM